MALNTFKDLIEQVKNVSKKTVVVTAAHDEHALESVLEAAKEGYIDYLLVGNREKIHEIAETLNSPVADNAIINI